MFVHSTHKRLDVLTTTGEHSMRWQLSNDTKVKGDSTNMFQDTVNLKRGLFSPQQDTFNIESLSFISMNYQYYKKCRETHMAVTRQPHT